MATIDNHKVIRTYELSRKASRIFFQIIPEVQIKAALSLVCQFSPQGQQD